MRRRAEDPAAEQVARVVDRLVVLLAAGTAPADAWSSLRRHGHDEGERAERATAVVEAAARAARRTGSPADGLRGVAEESWRSLGCAWALAERAGAPLGPALEELAASFRDHAQASRDAETALAAPLATSRLVLALPVVGLGLGALLGVDAVAVLATTPLGWGLVAVAALLVAAAWAWSRALVRRAAAPTAVPGLGCELVALVLRGGGAPARAVDAVRRAAERFALRIDLAPVRPALRLAAETGAPAATVLRGEARLARRRARVEAERRAARLGVTLVLPLGLCVLPAFVAVGVAPIVLAVVGDALNGIAP